MLGHNPFPADGRVGGPPRCCGSSTGPHGHIYTDDVGYNGRHRSEIFSGDGLVAHAITAMKDGVFTRGVLLDVAASCGRPWLPAVHTITRAELERAETAAGVTVEVGDALFVHSGLTARLAATTPDDPDRRAGLGIDAVLWLRERDVAVFGGGCVDLLPGPTPTSACRCTSSSSAR